jgi:hypothetical protein
LCDGLKEAERKYNVSIPWFIMTSKENNEETARKWRHDILEFCNQELNHKRHTKEQWDDVLPSCAEYERFCERNNIINEKATKAIKELNRRYEMHMANEDFLEENEI